jgi:hypothetical protein
MISSLRQTSRLAARTLRPAATAARAFANAADAKDRLAVLCILDGWGYRETAEDNAVILGATPHFDTLFGVHAQRGQVGAGSNGGKVPYLTACQYRSIRWGSWTPANARWACPSARSATPRWARGSTSTAPVSGRV